MSASINNKVTTQVPATIANLGPGYDCLGLALQLYNFVTLETDSTVEEEKHPMITEVSDCFFQHTKMEPFTFKWSITGDVPRSRGLGSSVTLRQGILSGLNQLSGAKLEIDELFKLCSKLEGHPDNAAPGCFGGFVINGPNDQWMRFEIPDTLHFALLIPEYEVLTEEARKVLPSTITHYDAIQNTANASMITAAFATHNFNTLKGAFKDYLHQDYRSPLIPDLKEVIEAGTEAGAYGGFLCGSGSAIGCICDSNTSKNVLEAMTSSHSAVCQSIIVPPDNQGSKIVLE